MLNTVFFKNTSGSDGTWLGQFIANGDYYQIKDEERVRWSNADEILDAISSGDGTIALSNDGLGDLSGTSAQVNYLLGVDSSPANIDGRKIFHGTPRQYGTVTYFTGAGDDPANEYNVGGAGALMSWHHETGQPTTQTLYADYNTIDNLTYLHAGALQWLGGLNDHVTCEVVPKLVDTYTAGSGYDYTIYGGYLIVPTTPGAGDVDVDAADRVLVEVPLNEKGQRTGAGYFDADWDAVNKVFTNFAPNYAGTGQFNMFVYEVVLDRFANKLTVLGAGMSPLGTHDASMFGHNCRLKFTYVTTGADHEWWGNIWVVFHRKKTK